MKNNLPFRQVAWQVKIMDHRISRIQSMDITNAFKIHDVYFPGVALCKSL